MIASDFPSLAYNGEPTFAGLLHRYFTELDSHKRNVGISRSWNEKTAEQCRYDYERRILPALYSFVERDTPAHELTGELFELVLQKLADEHNYRDPRTKKPYSSSYLKTVHNQLSAIFNHAVRFYGLKENPARTAGNMGSDKNIQMSYWTKEEYLRFAEAVMETPLAYYCFEVLYLCGLREGELMALTPADVNLEAGTIRVNKTFQHLKGRDVITEPKTPNSNRTVRMPDFLCLELRDYMNMCYGLEPHDRLFPVTKSFLTRHMTKGCKAAGVKKIRVHDLRHSHVSLLIDLGYSAVAIAERVGHQSIDITYRYAHLFPTVQSSMAEKLDAVRGDGNVG